MLVQDEGDVGEPGAQSQQEVGPGQHRPHTAAPSGLQEHGARRQQHDADGDHVHDGLQGLFAVHPRVVVESDPVPEGRTGRKGKGEEG